MTAVVGWCPGARRPMQTGDGLLVRVKPHAGRLSFAQAERLAVLSRRDGNGAVDLTSRANLQIRGVSAATLDRLTADLHAAGLLDPNAAVEAVRNVLASPLAGLDETRTDIRPVVAALERRLADDERLHRLPAKWSFVVDDGGWPSLSSVDADVRCVVGHDGMARLHLDGFPASACVSLDGIPALASRLGVLACGGPVPVRMRALAAAGHRFADLAGVSPAPMVEERRPPASRAALLGDRGRAFGLTPAFGSLTAESLQAALAILRAAGGTEVRLTPWRVLLVPAVAASRVDLQALREAGMIVGPDDPRLGTTACVGAPACHRATMPTRLHAAALATGDAGRVHLSGCAKGCGQAAPASWTLVGRAGHYDVVAQGTARDTPVAQCLSFPEAAAWISGAGQARTA